MSDVGTREIILRAAWAARSELVYGPNAEERFRYDSNFLREQHAFSIGYGTCYDSWNLSYIAAIQERDAARAALADRDQLHQQHIQAIEADRLRLSAALAAAVGVLHGIASQKLSGELSTPEVIDGDWVGGFDLCVKAARAAVGHNTPETSS